MMAVVRVLLVIMALAAGQSQAKDFGINMCFYCNWDCINYLEPNLSVAKANIFTFIREVSSKIETRLNTIPGYSFSIKPKYAWLITWSPDKGKPEPHQGHLYYKNATGAGFTGAPLVAHVSENFWTVWAGHGQPLVEAAAAKDCDVEFSMVSPYDPLWDYSGGVDAIANMMGICSTKAYGMVKINQNVEKTATLMAHELGHILGMYHDGNMNPAYASCDAMTNWPGSAITPEICDKLETQCSASSHNCAAGQGDCVMSPSVNIEGSYSGCSLAYFDMFIALADTHPSYTYDCMIKTSKRSLLDESLSIVFDEKSDAVVKATEKRPLTGAQSDFWKNISARRRLIEQAREKRTDVENNAPDVGGLIQEKRPLTGAQSDFWNNISARRRLTEQTREKRTDVENNAPDVGGLIQGLKDLEDK